MVIRKMFNSLLPSSGFKHGCNPDILNLSKLPEMKKFRETKTRIDATTEVKLHNICARNYLASSASSESIHQIRSFSFCISVISPFVVVNNLSLTYTLKPLIKRQIAESFHQEPPRKCLVSYHTISICKNSTGNFIVIPLWIAFPHFVTK